MALSGLHRLLLSFTIRRTRFRNLPPPGRTTAAFASLDQTLPWVVRVSPSAVIFDYGNVLSEAQPIADTRAMAEILHLPLTTFTELYWRFRVPYDAGTLTPTDYWNTVAQTSSRVVTAE